MADDIENVLLLSSQHNSPPGKISLLGLVMIVLQLVLTISMITYELMPQGGGFSKYDHKFVDLLLTIFMVLCIIGMLFSILSPDACLEIIDQENELHSNNYLMASVYVFGSGTIFLRFQEIYSYLYCYKYSSKYDLVYAIISLFHTALQIGLTHMYNGQILSYHWMRYLAFFCVVGTNVSTYITYIPYEMQIAKNSTDGLCTTMQDTYPVSYTFNHWKHYFAPFVSEYSLISIAVFVSIINNIRVVPNRERGDSDEIDVFITPPSSRETSPVTLEREKEMKNILEAKKSSLESSRKITFDQSESEFNRNEVKGGIERMNPAVLIGLILAALIITSSIVCLEHHKNDHHLWLHYSFMMFVSLLEFLSLYHLFKHITLPGNIHKELRADDILLLLTLPGPMLWDILVMIASVLQRESKIIPRESLSTAILSFLCNMFQLVNVFFQVYVFIGWQHLTKKLDFGKSYLKQLFYFHTIINLRFWLVDSFIGIATSTNDMYPMSDQAYGSAWIYISSCLYILAIFFRFHSASVSFELTLSRFKK